MGAQWHVISHPQCEGVLRRHLAEVGRIKTTTVLNHRLFETIFFSNRHFRHCNLPSFQRQLNFYHFQRDQSGCYSHPDFIRGGEPAVQFMKRKVRKTEDEDVVVSQRVKLARVSPVHGAAESPIGEKSLCHSRPQQSLPLCSLPPCVSDADEYDDVDSDEATSSPRRPTVVYDDNGFSSLFIFDMGELEACLSVSPQAAALVQASKNAPAAIHHSAESPELFFSDSFPEVSQLQSVAIGEDKLQRVDVNTGEDGKNDRRADVHNEFTTSTVGKLFAPIAPHTTQPPVMFGANEVSATTTHDQLQEGTQQQSNRISIEAPGNDQFCGLSSSPFEACAAELIERHGCIPALALALAALARTMPAAPFNDSFHEPSLKSTPLLHPNLTTTHAASSPVNTSSLKFVGLQRPERPTSLFDNTHRNDLDDLLVSGHGVYSPLKEPLPTKAFLEPQSIPPLKCTHPHVPSLAETQVQLTNFDIK
jgi:hypothetical protein